MKVEVLQAQFLASVRQPEALPPPAFSEIAFAGRSNVGKSSLINALLGRRKLVRISRTPGCTRGINIYRVKLSPGFVDLADLPGYGFARRSKAERQAWGPLIESFLQTRSNLRAVVVIVDIRRGIQQEDQQLLDFIRSANRPAVVVATKCDKLARSRRKLALAALNRSAGHPVHGFSAVSGEGREELLHAMVEIAFGPPTTKNDSP